MKRIHLHVAVADLNQSIAFYNTLFDAPPTVQKVDYAKWMLDDPLVNFAISQRGAHVGLDHIGIQVDSDAALTDIQTRLEAADLQLLSQVGTTCCYAKSDKHWVQDPSGIAWETYHTLESVPTFNTNMSPSEATSASEVVSASACCAPAAQAVQFFAKRN